MENIHFEDRKGDETVILRYILQNKILCYKVVEMAEDRVQMQASVSVVLNLRVFAARKLILYKIILKVTRGEVTQPRVHFIPSTSGYKD